MKLYTLWLKGHTTTFVIIADKYELITKSGISGCGEYYYFTPTFWRDDKIIATIHHAVQIDAFKEEEYNDAPL